MRDTSIKPDTEAPSKVDGIKNFTAVTSGRDFSFKINNWIFWVGLFLIFIGVGFAVGVENPTLLGKLAIAGITELGFAFFIAHVIIITVDRKEKGDFLHLMNEQRDKFSEYQKTAERRINAKIYLSQILDVDLPSSVSDELESYIISSKLIKREQKIEYKIEKHGNFTLLRQKLYATFENVYESDFTFEVPFKSHSEHKILHLTNEFKGCDVGVTECKLFKTENSNRPQEVYSFPKSNKDKFNPNDIVLKPGEQVSIILCYSSPKFGSDNELFTSTQLSEKFEISVLYDKAEYDVGYRSIHARNDCMDIIKSKDGDQISFNYPLLPRNGFMLWWYRNDQFRKKLGSSTGEEFFTNDAAT